MSVRVNYHRIAALPNLAFWLYDSRGHLIDFSNGVLDWTLKIGSPGQDADVTKTTGITGAVGSGTEDDGEPNVLVEWAPGQLDLTPGCYTLQLVANIDGGGNRVFSTELNIEGTVL